MTISANSVKELRERTGAGMMDCKKALEENQGDFEKSIDWLRQKGLSKAAKKAGRVAAEGSITSYIHGEGRIGVLLEVNSETDFAAKNEKFSQFSKDVAMHIAAMNPLYVSAQEIPKEHIEHERSVLKAKALEDGKKADFVDKIVDGQINKWCSEICLLDQKFVKNPDQSIQQLLTELVATIGENIVIRRFARYELGEGIQKDNKDFAQEVAEQLKG